MPCNPKKAEFHTQEMMTPSLSRRHNKEYTMVSSVSLSSCESIGSPRNVYCSDIVQRNFRQRNSTLHVLQNGQTPMHITFSFDLWLPTYNFKLSNYSNILAIVRAITKCLQVYVINLKLKRNKEAFLRCCRVYEYWDQAWQCGMIQIQRCSPIMLGPGMAVWNDSDTTMQSHHAGTRHGSVE